MKYIDMHCDTAMHLWRDEPRNNLYSNNTLSVDFLKLKQQAVVAQFFAIFLLSDSYAKEVGRDDIPDDDYINELSDLVKRNVSKHGDIIGMAYNYNDIVSNMNSGKVSAILTIEDGRSVKSIEKLHEYYNLGIRLIGLTWNYENCLGYPNSKDDSIMNKGLKELGIEIVEEMNRLGMIVDVSHLSDGGFYDVAKYSKKPFVASHSNARAICNHTRNLKDDMIKIIAEKGGAIGLNFCPMFLDDTEGNIDSRLEDMIRHVEYIRKLGGDDVIALGTDFDGIKGNLEIKHPADIDILFDAFSKRGFSDDLIEKFAYSNVLRVIKDVL